MDSREALAAALFTDLDNGLDLNDTTKNNKNNFNMAARVAHFGSNSISPPPIVTFWDLLVEAFDDVTVRILVGAGAASLALEFGLAREDDSPADWIEGASIIAAVAVVTLVTAGNNFQKEQQFRALQEVQADEKVRFFRFFFKERQRRDGFLINIQFFFLSDSFATPKIITTVSLQIRAIRDGYEVQLCTCDVLVGDLLLVETGNILCADGVLVAGTDIK